MRTRLPSSINVFIARIADQSSSIERRIHKNYLLFTCAVCTNISRRFFGIVFWLNAIHDRARFKFVKRIMRELSIKCFLSAFFFSKLCQLIYERRIFVS
ncbi:hypothetical protein BJL95_04420 [Methylomonas sp. LWB]|nr:hypothetical protein BJL95_04420 [Methylomonas sp. LWB]